MLGMHTAIRVIMMSNSARPIAMCSSANPSDSNVDTILTLPRGTGALAIAAACRDTALAFLNEAEHWGKAELAMWLMGPYAQATQYAPDISSRRSGEFVRTVPLLRDIDARMVDRVIRSARAEVLETLAGMADPEGAASFAFSMLSSGFVVRCEDSRHVSGWVPSPDARRLADRVLSLFAADYLTRPHAYELELSICATCGSVDFDVLARTRGVCGRHGSVIVSRGRRQTLPYLPEGA
jgi:hypothetical protein